MKNDDSILYLRRADVAAAGVPYLAMIDEVERCYRDWVEGKAVGHPKVVSNTPAGSFFYSLNAWSERLGIRRPVQASRPSASCPPSQMGFIANNAAKRWPPWGAVLF